MSDFNSVLKGVVTSPITSLIVFISGSVLLMMAGDDKGFYRFSVVWFAIGGAGVVVHSGLEILNWYNRTQKRKSEQRKIEEASQDRPTIVRELTARQLKILNALFMLNRQSGQNVPLT